MLKVATFNVNSIRARMPVLTRWLAEASPDVVALQETKVEDEKFPLFEIAATGYEVVYHGQQKYNGVAILSKTSLEDVHFGFEDDAWPRDCRVVRATVKGVTFVNTYVPNGTEIGTEKFDYKLRWFERFGQYIDEVSKQNESLIWLGDINVAPTRDDLHNPDKFENSVGFSQQERMALELAKSWGWTDCFRMFNTDPGNYTFWDYFNPYFKRNWGWRIDHIYATQNLAGVCESCVIDREPRTWEKPSDHTPVIATFSIQ